MFADLTELNLMNASVAVTECPPRHLDIAATPAVGDIEQRLPTPAELRYRLALPTALRERISAQRRAVQGIVAGRGDRLLVVVGPCPIHDPVAALEYARRLAGRIGS